MKKNPDSPHEAFYLKLDCSKARTFLKWRPLWNIETSIQKIVDWTKHFSDKKNMYEYTIGQIEEYMAALNTGC